MLLLANPTGHETTLVRHCLSHLNLCFSFLCVCVCWLFWIIVWFVISLIWGSAGSLLPCGLSPSCRDSCGAQASLAVKHRLPHLQALEVTAPGLESTGSTVVAHGLSCSMACWFFLDQGSHLCPLLWQRDSPPLSPWESPTSFLLTG